MRNPDPAILDANLEALPVFCPRAAEALSAAATTGAQFTSGRDGQPTYAWTDDTGRLRWLGRTSMPSVRAAALVDAFQPGTRNVLLDGFGQGAEIRLLLQRLAPHQAVAALDEDPWAVALSLRLYDFADGLRRGRLLIFTGPAAWSGLEDFLIEHDGFLTPERVLSWPWFDASAIAGLSDRLSAIGTRVARHRAAKRADVRGVRVQRPPPRDEPAIAVISNVPSSGVRRLGGRLKAAADSLGWPCLSSFLDSPAMVHPHAIESDLWRVSPTVVILLDTGPDALQIELPATGLFVACTHTQPLASEWVKRLPRSARLGVTSGHQRTQAVELGVDPSRILVLPPAAVTGLQPGHGQRGTRVAVVAEGHDVSAESVGLHLDSHCRLWAAATEILAERCDSYRDDEADAVLRAAERHLRIKIDSEDVRQGLVTRIRQVLGPVLVRRACCRALAEAGLDFDLYGGWGHDRALAKCDRGAWPAPADVGGVLAGHGLLISIEPSGCIHPALLDGLAAGLAGVVRSHPLDETQEGLSAVLDPVRHVWRFDSRAALVKLVRQFQGRPEDFRERSSAAEQHVNASHTWACRLKSILQVCLEG
ncbi:MAG: glycosyltransferase family 1 protein [Phycisphaerae bacterium]|nr:glycosyltransferase family 1 protein [Phycisphaerae bacterium]